MCHEGLMRTSLETASEISGGLSSGLQTHPHQTPYTLVQIKRQLSDHNILGVPTQMRDAPILDLQDIFQRTVEPIRPGRKYPRKHKAKPRKYFLQYKPIG